MDGQSSLLPTAQTPRTLTELQQEMARIEKIIEHVSDLREKPSVDIGSAVRLSRYLVELVAYRYGIEYAAGGQAGFTNQEELEQLKRATEDEGNVS